MGKDSEYYKEKKREQLIKLKELLRMLPDCAREYIHSKEMSSQTSSLISYCYDLLAFFMYLKEASHYYDKYEVCDFRLDDLENISSEDIYEYMRYLKFNIGEVNHENENRAIARKMAPLRGMYRFHLKNEHIKRDPTAQVDLPKYKKDKNIIRMNNYEVLSVLESVRNAEFQTMSEHQKVYALKTKQRDFAILTLMLGTGIRVSECRGLDLDDIDFIVNSLTIVRKGGGQDLIYFGAPVAEALKDYVEGEREAIRPVEGHEKALFYSMQGRRISVDAIEKLVKKYAMIAIPTKKITPHKLRSTYGTALYRETGDIRLVADVLGHENVNTTIDYYAAIEDNHKRSAADAVDFNKNEDNSSNGS